MGLRGINNAMVVEKGNDKDKPWERRTHLWEGTFGWCEMQIMSIRSHCKKPSKSVSTAVASQSKVGSRAPTESKHLGDLFFG